MKNLLKGMYVLLFLLCIASEAKPQEVVATLGSTHQNNSGSISYTLGELSSETYSTASATLTQGFHQPTITVVSINQTNYANIPVTAFPNPTSDFVRLQIENEDLSGLIYLLYDSDGKLLAERNIESYSTDISFINLNRAIYFIVIKKDGMEVKTLEICKQ